MLLMAMMGIGWAAIVSLPFAIMSQRVDASRIGLYMGVFNLSIVLPQLVVSLGVGTFVSRVEDKGAIFLIGAVSLALAAVAWRSVSGKRRSRQSRRRPAGTPTRSAGEPDKKPPPANRRGLQCRTPHRLERPVRAGR